MLQGMTPIGLDLVSRDQLLKSFHLMATRPCSMLFSTCAQVALTLPSSALPPDLASLLLEFDDVFSGSY